MTSEELAIEVGKIHADALARILGIGDTSYAIEFQMDQMDHQAQRFEVETLEDELSELEEELLDTINWAAMAILKLRARRQRAEADRHSQE